MTALVLGTLLACTLGAGAALAEPAAPADVDISAPSLVYDGDPGSDDAFALFLLQKNGQGPDLDLAKKQLKQLHHITYIATGPLSTLAGLLQDPDIKNRIDKVYIMGGNLWEDLGEGQNEFNFAQDPKAVDQVLKSGLDITLFPLDLTNNQIVDEPEIQKLAGYGTYPEFIQLLRGNQAAHAQRGMENAAVLHDIFPVLYLLDPEPFTAEDKKLAVDTATGALTEAPDGTTVHVVLGVNPRTSGKPWNGLSKINQRRIA